MRTMPFVMTAVLFSLATLTIACQPTTGAVGSSSSVPSAPSASAMGEPATDAPVSSPPSSVATPGSTTWKTVEPQASVPDDWRSCRDHAECVLVETKCCDHCNGGAAVSINVAHKTDVEAKYPRKDCKEACTERGCMTRPACESNRCTMQWVHSPP